MSDRSGGFARFGAGLAFGGGQILQTDRFKLTRMRNAGAESRRLEIKPAALFRLRQPRRDKPETPL